MSVIDVHREVREGAVMNIKREIDAAIRKQTMEIAIATGEMPDYVGHKDEIYGLHCDIGRLERDNAELRTQLANVTESMGRVEERCAKLQELVDYMTPIAFYAASERERDRMRELGANA